MNKLQNTNGPKFNNIAISFDGSIEQTKLLLSGIDIDIINRLDILRSNDFTSFNLFVIIFKKILDFSGKDIKNKYTNFVKEITDTFLLTNYQLIELENLIFGNESKVSNFTKKEVVNVLEKQP